MKILVMKISSALLLGAIVVMAGCSSESTNQAKSAESVEAGEIKVTYTDAQGSDVEKFVAVLAIEGMSCQMMCANKIQTTLKGLDGVISVDIAFESADVENLATVEFDKEAVSETEMIRAISELAGGSYIVKSVEVTHYIAAASEPIVEPSKVGTLRPTFQYELPNVFRVFAKVF